VRAKEIHDITMFVAQGIMADQNGITESGRKESNCVRCRNHGLKVVLRGHKQYCPYATCACDKCRFTAEQQRQMRLQNAIRRAESNGERPVSVTGRRPRNSNVSAPGMVSPQHQQQQQQQQHQTHQIIHQVPQPQPQPQVQQQIIVTTVASTALDQRNGGTPHGECGFVCLVSI
jgi:DM DNA binding domain